jgi:hypothetical protein
MYKLFLLSLDDVKAIHLPSGLHLGLAEFLSPLVYIFAAVIRHHGFPDSVKNFTSIGGGNNSCDVFYFQALLRAPVFLGNYKNWQQKEQYRQ